MRHAQLPTGLHGSISRHRHAGALTLSEATYPAGLTLPQHAHEHGYFCLVLRGGYTEACRSRTLHCKPMTVLHRAPGEPHADRFHDTGGQCAVVEIPTTWIDRVCQGPLTPETAEYQGGALPGLALRLYEEFRNWDDASGLAIQGLVLEMLAVACRSRDPADERAAAPWLKRCCEILHARFRERIFLDEIAREVNIHPSHLARAFRRQHRCTIGEYVRRLRIDFACRQLALPLALLIVHAHLSRPRPSNSFCTALGFSPVGAGVSVVRTSLA